MSYALGIDLGTTYTAAAIYRDGRLETVALGSSANSIPTVAYAREQDVLVGEAAAPRGLADPARLATEFKRRIGTGLTYILGGEEYTAEYFATEFLRSVYATVTSFCGGPPARTTLTHPAQWEEHRVQTLAASAREAGIPDLMLAPEPVAAACFYASQERVPEGAAIAVYDLGGGTFDATVVRKTGAGFEIAGSPSGDDQLGGVDFDRAVLEHVAESLGEHWQQLDLSDGAVAAGVQQLRRRATEAKEMLSDDVQASIPVYLPGINREVLLRRSEFEARIRPDIERTLETMRSTLADAGVTAASLEAIVLVGGSSRIPLVGDIVGAGLGRVDIAVDAHPKLAICHGAALLAAADLGLVEAGQLDTVESEPEPAPAPLPAPVPEPEPEPGPDRAESPILEGSEPRPTLWDRVSERRIWLGAFGVAIAALVVVIAVAVSGGGGGSDREADSTPDVVSGETPGAAPTPEEATTAAPTETPADPTATSEVPTPVPANPPLALPAGDPIVIDFWHSLPDSAVSTLDGLIDTFEAAHPSVTVEVRQLDSYDTTLDAVAGADPDTRPNVAVLAELAVQRALDELDPVMAQDMIDKDDFDPSQLLESAHAQYSDRQGRLQAVPFLASAPVVFLNLDLLSTAGVELDDASEWSTSDLRTACDQVETLGITCLGYRNPGWIFEELLANSGHLYFDSENGRAGLATGVAFDAGGGIDAFTFLADLELDGVGVGGGPGLIDRFVEGELAMLLTSASNGANLLELMDGLSDPFALGAAWLPHLTGTEPNGVAIGGGAMWLLDSGDDRENIAAWLLMEFLVDLPQQVALHRVTGYAPVRADATSAPDLAAFWEEHPAMRAAFDSLLASPAPGTSAPNVAAHGGRAGPFPEIRDLVVDALEDAQRGTTPIQDAFDGVVDAANQLLAEYAGSLG